MRLIGYEDGEGISIGVIAGTEIVCLGGRDSFWSDTSVLAQAEYRARRPLAKARFRPAIRPAAKVVCIGLNYAAHAREAGLPIPERPVVFSRWADTLICDGDPSPAMEPAYDWEAELGVVIGKRIFSASEQEASAAVFGYCTFNDLSCRSLQTETPQWTLGKNSDRSGPIGPIVTAEEAGDPASGWRITTHVNGEKVQDGITSDFIFSIPNVLAHLTRAMTLHPGDLVITGTPAGVGAGMKPPRFLKPGDLVRVEVEGLGAVSTPIVARPEADA